MLIPIYQAQILKPNTLVHKILVFSAQLCQGSRPKSRNQPHQKNSAMSLRVPLKSHKNGSRAGGSNYICCPLLLLDMCSSVSETVI